MKLKNLILALALPALLSVAGMAQESSEQKGAGAPKLAISEITHDFGEVKAGTPLRYTFKVKNEGSADLLIKNVAPG
ncbi:MAG TPA: DUF1573 domain-containing protein [Blastocatellia bacterium]|jgi:hypothetical protein|nr:DUF1573 domain-containing protein [Blastocatellia bacterium]